MKPGSLPWPAMSSDIFRREHGSLQHMLQGPMLSPINKYKLALEHDEHDSSIKHKQVEHKQARLICKCNYTRVIVLAFRIDKSGTNNCDS